jgi:hypothetical protein
MKLDDLLSGGIWILFGLGGLALSVLLGIVLYKDKPVREKRVASEALQGRSEA